MKRPHGKGRTAKVRASKRSERQKKIASGTTSCTKPQKQLDAVTRELEQAREQQVATAEVLRVIASSPGDLTPVFDIILERATRLCEAKFGVLWLRDEGGFRCVALHNPPPAFAVRRANALVHPDPDSALGRAASTRTAVQIFDLSAASAYARRDPFTAEAVELGGARTLISVPMLGDNELLGAISIYRQEVRPFTEKQIDLVSNFAAQAVIAIENTRLLKELRQRTGDLTEALEQQTATSEVLEVISSSPGNLDPVFESVLQNATRICQARFGNLLLHDGSNFRVAALHGAPPAWAEWRKREPTIRPGPNNPLAALERTKRLQHVADARATTAYIEREPVFVPLVELAGARTFLAVPMLKDDELIGTIVIYRQEVRPFTDKQIALLTNFAAQAVIAIENTRLLNELRQRTDDLSEHWSSRRQPPRCCGSSALARRSAGGVSSHAENCDRICEAKFGNLYSMT